MIYMLVSINVNETIFSLSTRLISAVTQQSTLYNMYKAKQQEFMREAVCDESPACSVSKHWCEETSRVLGDSDAPLCLSDL